MPHASRVPSLFVAFGFGCAIVALLAKTSDADVPYPPLSTCTITITQFPTRTTCISNFDPDVLRLTPAGSTATPVADRLSVTIRVRSPNNIPVQGAFVYFVEVAGIVNIASGGSTTATTDATGLATVSMHAASGYGQVVLCADGVQMCRFSVRSPDVAKGSTPDLCGLGTGMTSVSAPDITNPVCGFLVNFGAVTVGVNEGWDINCDNNVGGADVTGLLGKGGVLQYFADTGTLGATNMCP